MSHPNISPKPLPVASLPDPKVALDWDSLKGKGKVIEWDKLFSAHGMSLKFQKNQWVASLKPVAQSQAAEFYETLASDIVKHLKIDKSDTANLQELIKRINSVWTHQRLPMPSKPVESQAKTNAANDKIFFNAKSAQHKWLSNCFPTLIFDPSSSAIYMSVENVYQAKQTLKLDPSLSKEIAGSLQPISSMKVAKRAKKKEMIAKENEAGQKKGSISKVPAHDVPYMTQLVKLKFQQNPVLQSLLSNTGSQELVEHTNNSFWGDGSHGETTKGPGENTLGRIIAAERDVILQKTTQ